MLELAQVSTHVIARTGQYTCYSSHKLTCLELSAHVRRIYIYMYMYFYKPTPRILTYIHYSLSVSRFPFCSAQHTSIFVVSSTTKPATCRSPYGRRTRLGLLGRMRAAQVTTLTSSCTEVLGPTSVERRW